MNTYGVDLCDGIGSAEMFHIITNRPAISNRKSRTHRRGLRSEDRRRRRQRSADAWGRCESRATPAALCYWNAHEKSKETFAGDWCTSGDQFHVDENGYYWYHGRTDDMLKVSGVFVALAEIENCLLQHEAVLECAVVGHEAEGTRKTEGVRSCSRRIYRRRSTRGPIKQFVKSRIAVYKYPLDRIRVILPKNDRGKIDRKKLKG